MLNPRTSFVNTKLESQEKLIVGKKGIFTCDNINYRGKIQNSEFGIQNY